MKIESDAQHSGALVRVSVLMKSDPATDTPEGIELSLLAQLIEDYERQRWPLPKATP